MSSSGSQLVKWKPGESGNPSGRPVGAQSRKTIVKKWLAAQELVLNPLTNEWERLSQEDLIVLAMIRKARRGDVGAFNALMVTSYGIPKIESDADTLTDDVVIVIE